MAGGVRKWDVYVLDDMGCSPETMDVFLDTHDKNGDFNPNLGLWVDHCQLLGIHPFFAGTKMPVTDEGLQMLWLAERDLLLKTVRKFGKGWWKEHPDDFPMYKDFSSRLRRKVKSIPVDVVSKFESRKLGHKSMDEPVLYCRNAKKMILCARLDRNKAARYFESVRLPVERLDDSVLTAKREPVYVKRFGEQLVHSDEGLVKKSGGLFQDGGPAALADSKSGLPFTGLFSSLDSWGKDRIPGFGEDVHELAFLPDGRPGPNVKEWFLWCCKEKVHPFLRGRDYPYDDTAALLRVLAYERRMVEWSARLWKKRNAEVVMMESAAKYDKIRPIPGYLRAYGELHVGKFVSKLEAGNFSHDILAIGERMSGTIARNLKAAPYRSSSNRVFSIARREADRIFEGNVKDSDYNLEYDVKRRRGINL